MKQCPLFVLGGSVGVFAHIRPGEEVKIRGYDKGGYVMIEGNSMKNDISNQQQLRKGVGCA